MKINQPLSRALAILLLTSASTLAIAIPINYVAILGDFENPPSGSTGTGKFHIFVDVEEHTLRLVGSFAGLTGNVTVAHIHCCVAAPGNVGVATITPTFPGFPSGVKSGSYDQTFDTALASSFNASFVTAHGGTAAGAEAFLFEHIAAGEAYLNIHTSTSPGGEIRGFIETPEPATLALLGLGLAGFGIRRRKQAA